MQQENQLQEMILSVAKILIDELRIEDVTPETFDPDINLVDEVGIDSMDLATVALVLQDEYRITIDEEDYPYCGIYPGTSGNGSMMTEF